MSFHSNTCIIVSLNNWVTEAVGASLFCFSLSLSLFWFYFKVIQVGSRIQEHLKNSANHSKAPHPDCQGHGRLPGGSDI